MLLDSGIATILRGRNTAPNGALPQLVYDKEIFASYYADRTVGISRYWTAKAHDDQADALIRVQRSAAISTADRCRLAPSLDAEAAGTYKILQVQQVTDEDGLPMTDLTLERIVAIDGTG